MPTRFGFFFGFGFFQLGFGLKSARNMARSVEGGLFTILGRIEVLGIPVE